ncbi:hypothetical protein [Agromyces badenianii]|uniref:hypothetical protein n=1 Tax=Agromyces badenianii TaxID=2080742 RepID=UPI00105A2F24|nr:hypothetical protein [Agromyces badenianii]
MGLPADVETSLGTAEMTRAFLRYVWTSGFVAGFIIVAVLGVFYPGDALGKTVALIVSSAIVLLVLAIRFWVDPRLGESGVSSRLSIRLGTAEMPTDRELLEGTVVGVLADAKQRGRHFAAGTSAEGGSWLLVVARHYPYPVKYSEEGLTPGFVRRQLREWDARVVRTPDYRELVQEKYFRIY